MKYIKIAILSVLGASCLLSCKKEEKSFGPGTATVDFGVTEITVQENEGLFTIPLKLEGEPGGYPVTVQISATSGEQEIDKVLLISSTTIKITEENNSYVQMVPVYNSKSNDNYEVLLTIESANGASVGGANECRIYIENVPAIQYGQYTFQRTSGGDPLEWTLILREGPEGTYIAENFFDLDVSPKMIGVFDTENMQLVLDGRLNGRGEQNWYGVPGWGMVGNNYLAFVGGGSSQREPVVFTVSEDMYLESTSSFFALFELNPNDAEDQVQLGFFQGGTLNYEGETIDKEWPF